MKINRELMRPPNARIKPTNSQALDPFRPKQPSVYASPVTCPVDTALILHTQSHTHTVTECREYLV